MAVGSDHAGRALRQGLGVALRKLGYAVVDLGSHDDAPADYVVCARAVCRAILAGDCEMGVLCCGTGVGVSMAANRDVGIRAALCHDSYTAAMARAHNDANVLCLGQRVVGPGAAEHILHSFFSTPFAGGRHQRRVDQLGQAWEHP